MKVKTRRGDMSALETSLQRSFGGDTAAGLGGLQRKLKSIPTGSLALDYELGTGGWPIGHLIGIFGPRDIGKSSLIGFNAVKNAQAMDLNCAWIAVEPVGGDNWQAWAVKNGVDIDNLLVTYPETGEDAFKMLHMMLKSNAVDLIVFDSVGALLAEVEMQDDGKPRQGGQAGLITWGMKLAMPLAFRNHCAVLVLNQVRHNMAPGVRGVMYKQPGGEALEHMESIIVQLKRGKNRYMVKEDGNEVQIGNEIVAQIHRNKLSEGTGRKAVFDYFHADYDGYPFGIDIKSDIINTAKRTGVIKQTGSYFTLPNEERFQGMAKVVDYLAEHPEVLATIREGVLECMLNRDARVLAPEDLDEASED